jgi:hypothetical protein
MPSHTNSAPGVGAVPGAAGAGNSAQAVDTQMPSHTNSAQGVGAVPGAAGAGSCVPLMGAAGVPSPASSGFPNFTLGGDLPSPPIAKRVCRKLVVFGGAGGVDAFDDSDGEGGGPFSYSGDSAGGGGVGGAGGSAGGGGGGARTTRRESSQDVEAEAMSLVDAYDDSDGEGGGPFRYVGDSAGGGGVGGAGGGGGGARTTRREASQDVEAEAMSVGASMPASVSVSTASGPLSCAYSKCQAEGTVHFKDSHWCPVHALLKLQEPAGLSSPTRSSPRLAADAAQAAGCGKGVGGN